MLTILLIVAALLSLGLGVAHAEGTSKKLPSLEQVVSQAVEQAQSAANVVGGALPDKADIMSLVANAYHNAAEAAGQYGPMAFNALLVVLRARAIYDLIIGIVLLLVSVVAWRQIIAWAKKAPNDKDYILLCLFGGMGAIVCSVACTIFLFDFQMWLALIDPRLRLFYGIVSKFIAL